MNSEPADAALGGLPEVKSNGRHKRFEIGLTDSC